MDSQTTTILSHIQSTKPELADIFELLQDATVIIADQVKTAGLANILGSIGQTNSFGDEVQKLDDFTHTVLTETLLENEGVAAIVSEERDEPIYSKNHKNGAYIIFVDPLDGSSNIDTNCPIGTIFSIYEAKGGLLQKGKNQIAAGYVMYGSSVMFVYSSGNGVNGFTLDPTEREFFLTHPDITIPEHGKLYSINEGYTEMFDKTIQAYLRHRKTEKQSAQRFVGSLIADAHRTFIKGGIFLYPAYEKQPEGRLRLMLEVNPFAFLTEQAGGKALGINNESPLETEPRHIHDRSPFIMGSQESIAAYKKFTANNNLPEDNQGGD